MQRGGNDGPGLCPGACGDRSRPLPALASAAALASPTPTSGTGSTAFGASPAVPQALGAGLSPHPLVPNRSVQLSTPRSEASRPTSDTPRKPESKRVCNCGGGGFTCRGRTGRSQKRFTAVRGAAGGIPAAQASPATSGCFCRRCLSRVARRPKGTQQWGHLKRGPPGPRPCMRRWRLSLLLWAQA